jgi:hypothetical protein
MQSNQLNYITMKTTFRIMGCLALIIACGYAGSDNVTGAALSIMLMAVMFFLGGMFAGKNLHIIYAKSESDAGIIYARLREKWTKAAITRDANGVLESMLFDGYLLLVKPNYIVKNDYRYLTHLLICSGLKSQQL